MHCKSYLAQEEPLSSGEIHKVLKAWAVITGCSGSYLHHGENQGIRRLQGRGSANTRGAGKYSSRPPEKYPFLLKSLPGMLVHM